MEAFEAVSVTVLSKVVRLALAFTTNILLASILAPHDFGVYKTILSIATTMTLFTSFISPSLITVFTSSSDDKNKVFWSLIGITGASAVAISLIMLLSSPWLASFYELPWELFLVATLETFILSFNAIFFSFPEGLGNFTGKAKLVVLFNFLGFLSIPLSYAFGLLSALVWKPITHALSYAFSALTIIKEVIHKPELSRRVVKNILRTNVPLMASRATGILSNNFLVAFLGSSSPEAVAYYSLATMMVVPIQAFAGSIKQFGLFRVSGLQGDRYGPVTRMTKYSSYIAAFVTLSLVLFGREVIHIILPDAYLASIGPLYLTALGAYLLSTQSGLTTHFLSSKNTHILGKVAVIRDLASVLLALYFIPQHGALGAAASYCLSMMIFVVILHFVAKRRKIHAGRSYILLSLVAGLISLFIGKWLSLSLSTIYSLIIVPPTSLSLYMVVIWLMGGFDSYDKYLLNQASSAFKKFV